jgi:hypothetical protein
MFNDDGKFRRFCNIEDANTYYHDKLHLLKGSSLKGSSLKGSNRGFECRANQTNPIALYCYVF